MSDATSSREPQCLSIVRLILVPAVITLAVTILRLIGELLHWSKVFFNSSPGGGGALVGIVWLVPIFGVYFALRLTKTGETVSDRWRPLVYALLGLVLMVASGFVFNVAQFKSPGMMVLAYLLMAAAALIPLVGWPALGKTLLAYAYAARIPVALVMFFAMRGSWGTHYDAPPPGLPPMSLGMTYIHIGLLPQLIVWVAFTVVVGTLLGGIVNAVKQRRTPASGASA